MVEQQNYIITKLKLYKYEISLLILALTVFFVKFSVRHKTVRDGPISVTSKISSINLNHMIKQLPKIKEKSIQDPNCFRKDLHLLKKHLKSYKNSKLLTVQNTKLILDWYGGRNLGSVEEQDMGKNYKGPFYVDPIDSSNCDLPSNKNQICLVTNIKSFENQADSILIDYTRLNRIQQKPGLWRRYFNIFNSEYYEKAFKYKTITDPDFISDFPNMNPKNRCTENQYWAAYLRESAAKSVNPRNIWKGNFDRNGYSIDSSFNWTVSYRRDSDVYLPFSSVREVTQEWQGLAFQKFGVSDFSLENSTAILNKLIMDNKHKDTVYHSLWYVSNCDSNEGARNRKVFGDDLVLSNSLKVDIYGACYQENATLTDASSPLKFSHYHKDYKEILSDKSNNFFDLRPLASKYKFYLAFENGRYCTDYITEKFWTNGLRNELVPVVYGPKKSDYLGIAPRNSFIHVDDFNQNFTKLVEYLNFLDKNDEEYLKFHEWRLLEMPKKKLKSLFKRDELCKVCRKLWSIDDSNEREEEKYRHRVRR